jgi:alpha-L-fucosidase
MGTRAALDALFATPVIESSVNAASSGRAVVLPRRSRITVIELAEPITEGQRISGWRLRADEPGGPLLAAGTTIGYRQLRRIAPASVSRLILEAESLDGPVTIRLRAFGS